MRLLLDTHIALWAVADDPRLSAQARSMIANLDNEVYVSVVSLWEIAIKYGLGRGDMPVSAAEALGYFTDAGYRLLDIRPHHAVTVERLPAHHGDPFDRLLIAQAQIEPLHLITHDVAMIQYGENIVRV